MPDAVTVNEVSIAWPARLWLVLPVALVVSVIATLLCEKTALRLGIVDKPDDTVKTHKKPTPYLGGVAIFGGILAGMLVSFLFVPESSAGSVAIKWGFGILAAGAVACIVGVLDDIFDIRPWQKVLGQTVAAIILVAVGVRPEVSSFLGRIPQTAEIIVQAVIVILFVLGATNSLNLLDGLDGLCAGVTAIMAAGMLALAALMGTEYADPNNAGWLRAILCLALPASVLGFLIFNYPRRSGARIFMGDAGSLLLGLNMAALMMLFAEKEPRYWLASIVIFGLPILDTAVAFARRIINKRPLFVSDRGHIYDQMMDRGISLRKTVNLCYALTAVYVLAGLFVSQMPLIWALVTCVVVAAVSGLVVWCKGYLRMAGLRGVTPQKTDL
jgi:UDP-GlcNAc:undecaprenyl-phosphate GlcNAc-1-phosphate transferase